MKTGILGLTLWICAAVLGGCASIINSGNPQPMSFQSNPPGATVTIIRKPSSVLISPNEPPDSRVVGQTPLTAYLPRTTYGQAVVFSKEGYTPLEIPIQVQLTPWFWGNAIFGGGPGSLTDISIGAAFEYEPGQFLASLNPIGSTSMENGIGQTYQDRVTMFILRRHGSLISDFSKGSGEDLEALLNLLQIPEAQRKTTRTSLYWLSESYPDPRGFADQVVAKYHSQKTATACGPGASC